MDEKEQIKEELWCEALESGYTMRYRALGGSMFPFIRHGNILTVKPDRKLHVGDVILYRNNKKLIAHRLIKKMSLQSIPYLITKGDNLKHTDSPVSFSELLGKIKIIENGEKVIQMDSFWMRVINYAIGIISPILLPEIVYILRKIRKFNIGHKNAIRRYRSNI